MVRNARSKPLARSAHIQFAATTARSRIDSLRSSAQSQRFQRWDCRSHVGSEVRPVGADLVN